jgi:V-type H+-transporting ATPase subunit F
LAGVGHRTAEGSNFLIVKPDTPLQMVEETFTKYTNRADIGIILINQHVANEIRHVLKDYNATIPTVLEIPSKEHPYDPEQDYIMVGCGVRFMFVIVICYHEPWPTFPSHDFSF